MDSIEVRIGHCAYAALYSEVHKAGDSLRALVGSGHAEQDASIIELLEQVQERIVESLLPQRKEEAIRRAVIRLTQAGTDGI